MKIKPFKSQSFDFGLKPFGLENVGKKEVEVNPENTDGDRVTLDANFWLPLAAPHYNISKHLQDYLLVPVPSVISDIPNTNGDCTSKDELLLFSTVTGMPAYKTFKGKGCYEEHQNQIPKNAKGIILDVYLKPLKGFGNDKHFKVVKLLAFDRTKDWKLCDRIASGETNTYSMGLYYDSYTCSICNHTVYREPGRDRPCVHTNLKTKTKLIGDKLAYRLLHNLVGFETSLVKDPAFVNASSDIILNR